MISARERAADALQAFALLVLLFAGVGLLGAAAGSTADADGVETLIAWCLIVAGAAVWGEQRLRFPAPTERRLRKRLARIELLSAEDLRREVRDRAELWPGYVRRLRALEVAAGAVDDGPLGLTRSLVRRQHERAARILNHLAQEHHRSLLRLHHLGSVQEDFATCAAAHEDRLDSERDW